MRKQCLRVVETRNGLRCHMISESQFKRSAGQAPRAIYQIKDGPLCHIQAPKSISPEVTYQLVDDWYLQWQSDGELTHKELADRIAFYPKSQKRVPVGGAGGGNNGP